MNSVKPVQEWKESINFAIKSNITGEQCLKIASFYPEANRRGRPRTQDFREITNAILYLVRAGCAWRLLPHDFPKWQTVYYYFRRWQKDGLVG